MKKIEKLDELNALIQSQANELDECVLRVYDNKSNVLLQTIVVKHPVVFIRGLQDFCKSLNLPVLDVSVRLIGFISDSNNMYCIDEVAEVSPYVYFNKSEEVKTSKE